MALHMRCTQHGIPASYLHCCEMQHESWKMVGCGALKDLRCISLLVRLFSITADPSKDRSEAILRMGLALAQLAFPVQVQRLISKREAEAMQQGVTWSGLAAEVDPSPEDPEGLLGMPYACHVAILNYMGPTGLFSMLCEVGCLPAQTCMLCFILQDCRVGLHSGVVAATNCICRAGPEIGHCEIWAH